MSDVFLGAIAVAVLVMAARLARRVDRFADRVEQDIRPIVASLQALTADAARATSVFKAILAIFRGPSKEARATTADEEDPLFIG
jgi:hypothetical protein